MSSWPAAAAAGTGVDTWGRDDKMAESWLVDVSTRGGRLRVGWGVVPDDPRRAVAEVRALWWDII